MTIELPIIVDTDKSSHFKNCIRKNYLHIRKWAFRVNTNCFRIYDRDIKEYPIAIDYYDGRFCVHYFDFDEPREDLAEITKRTIHDLFGDRPIYARTRIRREKTEQYEKVGETKEFFQVLEYGVKFWVNLKDYLDTGLFLDHREVRRYVASIAKEKRLLNLFAYTCSFSVHAAFAGAKLTKSVDMSNTYTAWGEDNFRLNNLPLDNHPIIRADCLKFLETEKGEYDIIVIDPPTISRSKKMDQMFDIQEDYIFLITKALPLLAPDGVMFFSTNSRKFILDPLKLPPCQILNVTQKTLPIDFRDPKIHQCWRIKNL
ncbi:MAG TPA: class I SAM-dependent methyltransferase [Chlamydiales bacterium]|nr:class I SAM-dependent methyltransferase [Chlamydiales bacterium]